MERKKLFIIGNILASAIIAVFVEQQTFGVLLAAAIAEGIAEQLLRHRRMHCLQKELKNREEPMLTHFLVLFKTIAFGVGSLIIPIIVVFETIGFTNKEGHVLLYVILALLSLSSTLFMFRISEPRRVKRHGVSWRRMLPHKSKDPLSKYVLTSGLIAFGAGLVVPLMAAWLGLQFGISDAMSGPILGLSSLATGVATLAGPLLPKELV